MDYIKILKSILIPSKRGIDQKKLNRIVENKNKYFNIFNFLLYKVYKDSISIEETLKRLILNIDIKPLCPICGKPVNFIGKKSKMFSKYCSNSCRAKDPQNYNKWVEGQKKYNIEHYGVVHNFQREDCKEKRKQSLIKHYGTDKLYKVDEIREKIKKSTSLVKDKMKENYKNTLEKNYGIDSFGKLLTLPEIQEKRFNTMKLNHTFNSSQLEENTYILLKTKFINVKRQYKSEEYPFNCDFYIPELNLYIECNYHWTHGEHPYNLNNLDDYNQLKLWENKNTNFYKNAIITWTCRDVNKREIAKAHNLNWIEFFNYNEFINWIKLLDLFIYFDKDKIKKEYEKYKSSKGNLNSVYINPYIIKYFQQDIFYKKEKELWKNENIKDKLISNRIKYLNKNFEELTDIEYFDGFKRSMIYYGYSHFNPLWFKWFIENYNIKKCYDPCGGWGHRLLGSSMLELYIYNDISPNIYKNVNRIIDYFDIKNTKSYNNNAIGFVPNEDFDAMFTCPPYYNVEIYETGEFENIEEYNKLIDSLFDVFNKKKNCKIFGLVIREDLIKYKLEHIQPVEKFLINNRKNNHITNIKRNNEYLYIFKK